MASLIVDSPWLPGFAGCTTLDFYFDPSTWLSTYIKAYEQLAEVALLPGSWVELGMALEPSGFGVPVIWSPDSPPAIRPFPSGLAGLLAAPQPDPERDGLMPVALRQYERLMPSLEEAGIAPRIVAARGPLAIAAHLLGITELLLALRLETESYLQLLDRTTQLCIDWLTSQLERVRNPLGVLVLDDVVGLMGPGDAERCAQPQLRRVFDAFPGLLHLFHNDTPNPSVYPLLADIGMDVFNFSHEVEVSQARQLLGPEVVLMGNIPPLDVLVRGTRAEVEAATHRMLRESEQHGPMLISAGGGVSPGTPLENLTAMAARVAWAS